MQESIIKTVRFDALNPGPHLVVLGAVHGDEKCGSVAIERLIAAISANQLTLEKGSLTCVPIANPKAYALNTRFCERNLNRALYIKDEQQYYEDTIDPVLCRILDQADALIDLHSYASTGGAFSFLGTSTDAEIEFCRSLSIQDFVYGWSEAFSQVLADPRESQGTVDRVRAHGGIATTIECGHHHNKNAADIGYQALLSGLASLGLTKSKIQSTAQQTFVKMHSVFLKTSEGQLAQDWCHYDKVKAGTLLASFDAGEQILAPIDGRIILPKTYATIGGEWFYFGVETDCPVPK